MLFQFEVKFIKFRWFINSKRKWTTCPTSVFSIGGGSQNLTIGFSAKLFKLDENKYSPHIFNIQLQPNSGIR